MIRITICVPDISLRRQMRVPLSIPIGNLKKYIPNYQNIISDENSNLLNQTKTMVFDGIELKDDDTIQSLRIKDGDFIIGFQLLKNKCVNNNNDNRNGYIYSQKNGYNNLVNDLGFWMKMTDDGEDFRERMNLLSRKELRETIAKIRDLRMTRCFERPTPRVNFLGKMKSFYENEPNLFKRSQIKLELGEKPEEPSAEPLPVLWI